MSEIPIEKWFEQISNQSFLEGVFGSIIAVILTSLGVSLYRRIRYLLKEKGFDTRLNGFWIVSWVSRYTNTKIVEIYRFRRVSTLRYSGMKYRFKYQQFNNKAYQQKPLFGGGIILLRGIQIAGVYGIDEKPMVVGTLLLKVDTSVKGKHSPRLLGSFYEYSGDKIHQTLKNKYILYKISLPFWYKVRFLFGRSVLKGFEKADQFYSKFDFDQ